MKIRKTLGLVMALSLIPLMAVAPGLFPQDAGQWRITRRRRIRWRRIRWRRARQRKKVTMSKYQSTI